ESLASGVAKQGDLIIITAGVPVTESGTTNVMKIQLIGEKVVKGQGIGSKSVIGKAIVAKSNAEALEKAEEGGILIVKTTDKEMLPAFEKSAAVVVEEGGLTSHAAVVGINLGIPVIVGAKDATSLVKDGEIITVDSRQGVVYNGKTATH
ncbi:TPA: pyruvate kinase, partial [Listeria monocytogenes]|nr:pyruvate kinase [Listeria monocytogenes]